MKKEKPILFSAPMVRAILEGRKTQTRRLLKPQPIPHETGGWRYGKKYRYACSGCATPADDLLLLHECPYGLPGDLLWVRETWQIFGHEYAYAATDKDVYCETKWRPSIHMPRAASRLTLEIINIRIERLQDISEADAIAEGVETIGKNIYQQPIYKDYFGDSLRGEGWSTAQRSFLSLWEKINGHHSWDANPWVWAITFQKIE